MLEILSAFLGVGGGLLQRWLESRERREQAQIELARAREAAAHELALEGVRQRTMELEAQHAMALAQVNAAKEADVAAYAALAASHASDRATYSTGLPVSDRAAGWLVAVDVVRGLTRPALTLLLSAALIWLCWMLPASSDQLAGTIETLRYLAGTALGWWFAARGSSAVALPARRSGPPAAAADSSTGP